jgi:putative sigma-54 modulation protein
VARLQISVRGKNVEITSPLREYLQKRLGKVERHFSSDVTASVTVTNEPVGYGAEITIPVNGLIIRAEEKSQDLYSAVDLVVDKIVRQISKFRGRLHDRRQGPSIKQLMPLSEVVDELPAEADAGGQIVRVKRFAMRPMAVEEALLQMNLLGHDFFVFVSAETGLVTVVYRRRDGNYGLIEPER